MRITITSLAAMALLALQLQAQDSTVCGLTGDDMKDLNISIKNNILSLIKTGRIDTSQWSAIEQLSIPTSIRFAWPLRSRDPEAYTYYHIGNFTDLDTTGPSCKKDYTGGLRTYNRHQGIDIGVGPYHWQRQAEGSVYVIAAAPGTIVERVQGRFDQQCTWDNGDPITRGNHIALLHDDGQTVSYYMHMKDGSLTSLQVGDRVNTGTYLGTVASSGNSTGPHLHFQVNVDWEDTENLGHFVEPFAGPENYTTTASLWIDQKPYNEPAIYNMEVHLGTNTDWYTDECDKDIDLSTMKNQYSGGNSLKLRTWYRDWVDASSINMGVQRPDGSSQVIFTDLRNDNTSPDRPCASGSFTGQRWRVFYQTREITLPAFPQTGTWNYWVTFGGVTYRKYFSVGCTANQTITGALTGSKGYLVSNNITSTATISGASTNKVEMHADNAVILSPGFTASQGATFRATNNGCSRVE